MALFTKIVESLGLGTREDLNTEPGQKPKPGEAAAPSDPFVCGTANVEQRESSDDPILLSLKYAWSRLLSEGVPRHLKIAPDDALFLERIEITARSDAFQRLLTRFMSEFRPQARIDYVKRELGKDLQRNLVLNQFTGIWDNSNSEASNAEAPKEDAFDEILAGPGGGGKGSFDVRLIGHWGENPRGRSESGSTAPAENAGARLQLTLWDGDAPNAGRSIIVDTYPTALGRKGDSSDTDGNHLLVTGTYVSSLHGILDWDGVAVTISDGPSRNGLWLNEVRVQAGKPLRLTAGDWLRLSSPDDRNASHYPRFRVDKVEAALATGQTPVTTPVAGATPVMEAADGNTAQVLPVLALLSISDAAGSHQVDLTHLPFRLGRSQDQDYVIPDANAGISGSHLEIVGFDELGARVKHLAVAKNGCSWADSTQDTLPGTFHWPYGREIVLAQKYTKAAPVHITLRKVA